MNVVIKSPILDKCFFLGNGIACAALGLSKGILLSSVQIIVLELLDTAKFSVGLGIIFGLVGLCTTALGPLNGNTCLLLYLYIHVYLAQLFVYHF